MKKLRTIILLFGLVLAVSATAQAVLIIPGNGQPVWIGPVDGISIGWSWNGGLLTTFYLQSATPLFGTLTVTVNVAASGGSVPEDSLFVQTEFSGGNEFSNTFNFSLDGNTSGYNVNFNGVPQYTGQGYMSGESHTVPEPHTLLLLGIGLVGLAGYSRFKKREKI